MSRLQKESSFLSVASTSQEDPEEGPSLLANNVLRVTLLASEWRSSKGGLSTINRELAIQLAKHPNVEVSVYLPQCSEEDKRAASDHEVQLIEAKELPGYQPTDWLASLPENHLPHCVIGHGLHLGRQISVIKRYHHCKWIQVVHTAPEELGMFKSYEEAISKGQKKHQDEVKLCEWADQVVAIGPKLADAYSRYLRFCKKDQDVFDLTPSIFTEFSHVEQATEERKKFCVLVFGRGDSEDFELKGYDIAVRSIAQLEETYHLMFVGAPEGKEDEVAEKLLHYGIPRSQLTVRRFKEDRKQLANLFYEVDLVIMPSRTEGFGLTALEALSAGLPVLVSGKSGLGEALQKVLSGFSHVVNSEDPKQWANAIRIVRRKGRELRLQEATILCENYAAKYSWQKQCKCLVETMVNLAFGYLDTWRPLEVEGSPSPSIAACTEHESSTNVTVHHEDTVVDRPRQGSTEKVKRSSSQLSAQSAKRLKGYGCCLVVEHLEDEYIRRSNVKPLLWNSTIQLSIDEVFTRLQVKWRRKADFRVTGDEVHMYDIFKYDKESGKRAKMVLIEGNPGIGKTTFCLKIASDWAKKVIPVDCDFPMFQLLFLLKCCHINEDIIQAIDAQLLPEDMKSKEELMDYVRNEKNQDKILIILDGLDELPRAAEHILDKLLRRKVLSRCFILATSREEKGIEVRQRYDFDTLLQIKGFTTNDASDYIRRHFKIVDPQNLSKGERLIQAVTKNAFLHALRNNPLNLLLLCVVFEDFEGELPSNRTKLYQIIFRCLLRRFCSKNGLDVHYDDEALENQFESTTLLLGKLAWRCLQEDRPSFSEEELDKLEKLRTNIKGFQAIKLGLVFMEASVKKLKPQHQCHFLHKTFQEFLAAVYLAHKILTEQLDFFDDSIFNKENICGKYRQVFFFVAGILGKDGTTFFKQMGKILNKDWSWHSPVKDCEFLIELLSESGAADDLGRVVCPCIPLPNSLELSLRDWHCLRVIRYAYEGASIEGDIAPVQLTKLSLAHVHTLTKDSVNDVRRILESSQSLTELAISNFHNMASDVAVMFGRSLLSSTSLKTLRVKLFHESSDRWARVVSAGLSTLTQLRSVVLQIYGVVDGTAAQAVKLFLFKPSLLSFSLIVYGDVEDCLVSSVSEGLVEDTALESLTVVVHGRLSNHGTVALQKGVSDNRTLHLLKLQVYGDIPEAWTAAVASILASSKSWTSLAIHPNVCGKIENETVSLLYPIQGDAPSEKSLTVNVCGELSIHSAKALGDFFRKSGPLSSLHLNVRSNISNDVVDCLVNFFLANNLLSSLSIIDLWSEMTSYGRTALQRVLKESQMHSFILNVHGLATDDHVSGFDVLDNVPSPSASFSVDGRNTTPDQISRLLSSASLTTFRLTVNNHADTMGDWAIGLPDGLAKNISSSTFSLTVNNQGDTVGNWAYGVDEGLANSTSLTTFSPTVNNYVYDDTMGKWAIGVGDGLAKNTSLTTFSLTVNNDADPMVNWAFGVGDGLAKSRSLTTFSLTVNNHTDTMGIWATGVGDGLAENTSLTSFSLTVNNHADKKGNWATSVCRGLAKNTSLTTFSLTVNNHADTMVNWAIGVGDGLKKNTSLTTFSLTVNNHTDTDGNWAISVGDGLAKNTSLTTFILTVHNHTDTIGNWALDVGDGLAKSTSLTTFSLTVNNHIDTMLHWAFDVGYGLAKSTSLTTFSLTVNNHTDTMVNWLFDVGDGLAKSTSLTTFSLTVNSHAVMMVNWATGVGRVLAKNTSLTTFSLTVNNYADTMGNWAIGVGDGLKKNTSLTTFSLIVNNHTDTNGNWAISVGDGLAKNTSLTAFILTVNNYADTMENWAIGVGDGLAKNTSLTTFSLTVNNHTDTMGNWSKKLGEGLAKSSSLTTLRVAFSLYGVDRVC